MLPSNRPPLSELPGFTPVPADGVYTEEWRDRLFSGNQTAFLRDIARLAQAAPIAAVNSDGDERLAASAPRRPSPERHPKHTSKSERDTDARLSA